MLWIPHAPEEVLNSTEKRNEGGNIYKTFHILGNGSAYFANFEFGGGHRLHDCTCVVAAVC